MSTPELLKATLKRAPFTIFSKAAPSTLPKYNVDTDFCYYFFNDIMDALSGISPHFLTENSNHNSKTDFPTDYKEYFKDDVSVCLEYPFPLVKVITEHWATPAMDTIVETRKTAMIHGDQNYMLGCFGPHDDIELGITTFRATMLPPVLEPIKHVTDGWYEAAFQQLPFATTLINTDDMTVIAANDLATTAAANTDDDDHVLEQSVLERMTSNRDCFQTGSDTLRTWIWRPCTDRWPSVVAIAVREKHAVHPKQITEKLTK